MLPAAAGREGGEQEKQASQHRSSSEEDEENKRVRRDEEDEEDVVVQDGDNAPLLVVSFEMWHVMRPCESSGRAAAAVSAEVVCRPVASL